MEVSGDTPWFNNQAYVNTLDKNAINQFIEITHQEYYKRFADEFGKTIPAIFTDEPQTCHKEVLSEPFEKRRLFFRLQTILMTHFKKIWIFNFRVHSGINLGKRKWGNITSTIFLSSPFV